MLSTNIFNELRVKITATNYSEKNLTGVCNPMYFWLCIDLMHITPPVTAEGFDGSHHPRYAECTKEVAGRTTFSHIINIAGIIYYTCSLVIDIECTRYLYAFNNRF